MIREMKESDWESVCAIYTQSLLKGDVTFTVETPSYETWDENHIKQCRFVFEKDGKILGFTVIAPTSKMPAYWGSVELSIFVDENHLRQGIGTQLLDTLCAESEKLGYWSLYSVICSINKGSIALHKKCGFRVIGTRERVAKDRFGNWQDTTIMERRNGVN